MSFMSHDMKGRQRRGGKYIYISLMCTASTVLREEIQLRALLLLMLLLLLMRTTQHSMHNTFNKKHCYKHNTSTHITPHHSSVISYSTPQQSTCCHSTTYLSHTHVHTTWDMSHTHNTCCCATQHGCSQHSWLSAMVHYTTTQKP